MTRLVIWLEITVVFPGGLWLLWLILVLVDTATNVPWRG